MAVQIIKNLQECEAQQSFCVMIAQTFLVQNWVRGLSADSGTKVSCNYNNYILECNFFHIMLINCLTFTTQISF